jgi:hypothetical protein
MFLSNQNLKSVLKLRLKRRRLKNEKENNDIGTFPFNSAFLGHYS